jgi:Tol biopolymer transport system component/DNA-binding winged helix-turn-helix (wHTH) protein
LATYGSLRRACARFESFRVDLSSNELFRSGVRVPIQEQPLQVLRLLLEAEGKVVTREQLCAALWPENTFVDFEHGVNTAVKKLRQALEDSVDHPKFVATLPKIGYRFIASVEWVADTTVTSLPPRVVPIGPPALKQAHPLAGNEQAPRLSRWAWRFAPLASGLLLLALIGGYLLRPRSQIEAAKLTISPFTTFPGFEIAPSFSPDGNQIVFSWFGYEREFQFDLYVKQVGGEQVLQLTHHPATFLVPAWSPDGRSIAFMRQAEPEATGIYLISPLGGTERKLAAFTPYFGGWDPIALSWSADGKWLAFAKTNSSASKTDVSAQHFRIHLVNVETTEERTLPDPAQDCVHTWQPAFSPDGKYLASVCVLGEGVAKIYVQSLDGKQSREVRGARSSEVFAGIAWAVDNQSLLYSSDQHLWRISLSGGTPEKLLFAQDVESVAVARTGNRLAFAQVRHPDSIWQIDLAGKTKSAGPATKIISSSLGDTGPHLSPDGKYLAFQSWRSGSPEIWICDRDTSNPVQLTSFGGAQTGAPNWSPDGRRIVFDLRTSGNAELYVVNVDGGPPRRFPTGTANAANPFWSADAHWIYFNTERPDAIWKVPLEGGTPLRLTEGKGQMTPLESADGTSVFFYKLDEEHIQAWSVSANGGDEHRVMGMPDDVGWVPSTQGIYFMNGSPRHFALNYFDFVTRQAHKIADLPGLFNIGSPHLSPDGHAFLFSGIEHSEGDIVLVDGFR